MTTDWVTLNSKPQGSSSQEDLPIRAIHPCRVQVPLTLQCIFLLSSLLNRGMLLTLPYESGKQDTGRLNGETKVTLAEDEVKPKPSELQTSSGSESHAVGGGSLGCPVGWKALSHDLCPSSLLKPALWFLLALFLIVLWHIRHPRTDHYAVTFEVTFMYMPVQDSVLQTCLQKGLVSLPFSIHKPRPEILQSGC